MSAEREGVDVRSGLGFRTKSGDPTPVPIVRLTVNVGGDSLTTDLLPHTARRIGLDLIAAASQSAMDAGVFLWARETGTDAEPIQQAMRTATRAVFDEEPET